MRYYILSIVLFFFIVGCADNQMKVLSEEHSIAISDGEIATIIPDSIFEKVDYIKLETSNDVIIRNIDKVVIDEHIYILDKDQNEIFIFENDGKLISNVGKRGQGPDEYISISDFSVQKGILYILCPAAKSIKMYNVENSCEFLGSINIEDYYYQFAILEGYIYLYNDFSSMEFMNIAVYNIETNKIEIKYQDFSTEQIGVGHKNFYVFFNCGNSLYSTFPYDYSIYKLHPDRSKKIRSFNFGEKHMFPLNMRKASSEDRKDYLIDNVNHRDYWLVGDIENIVVTNSSYIFSFNYLASNYTAIQNKDSAEIIWGYIVQTDLYPLATSNIHYYQDEKIIQVIDVEMVFNAVGSSLEKNIPKDILNVDFDANPIIGLYTLKDKYK